MEENLVESSDDQVAKSPAEEVQLDGAENADRLQGKSVEFSDDQAAQSPAEEVQLDGAENAK